MRRSRIELRDLCLPPLAHGSGLGFFCSGETADDPHPDAWRGECDERMMADGGWNEANEELAGITLICARCYDAAKSRNTRA